MYTGGLGQVGERFMLYAEKGRSVSCPAGTRQESSGRMGTGQQYVQCYRPPVFAPPPVTTTTISPVITTKVPTVVTTAVSPQISPTMAVVAASPGAAVSAAPVSAPGPTTGAIPSGITEAQLRDILSAQQAAVDAEREFEERKRASEIEELRRQMSERERASQEIYLASQKAEADRVAADRFATAQATASAIESQALVPPPASTTYMPTGGGTLPAAAPSPMLPPPDMTMAPTARDVTITQDGETPWALILLAVAGVGVVAVMGKKGGKRKRGKS